MKTSKISKKSKPSKSGTCPKIGILSRISNFIHNLSKTFTGLMIFIVIIIVIVVGYKNFRAYSVIIEPFNVPSSIESQGYNGQVMANKLIDQMNNIRVYGQEKQDIDKPIASLSGENESMKIPGVGISFDYILRQIGRLFGCKTVIVTNDAFKEDNKPLKITTRVDNTSVKTFSRYGDEALDDFLLRIAEYISKYTQPIQLASYYNTIGDYDNSILTIQHVLNNEPDDDDSLAYVVWGDVLLDRDDNQDEAIGKYMEAIELDSKNYQAYNNWGNVLFNQGNFKEAIVKYKKAAKLAPKILAPNLNLGLAYEKEGELDKAVKQYTEVTEDIINVPLSVLLNLARTYTAKGEEGKAEEILTEAVEKDESLIDEIKEEEKFKTLPAYEEIID